MTGSTTLLAQEKSSKVETVKFEASMTCDGCVETIMSNIPHEKGIKKVNCDLKSKTVEITFVKEKNSVVQLQRALEKLGYTVKEVKEEPKKEKK